MQWLLCILYICIYAVVTGEQSDNKPLYTSLHYWVVINFFVLPDFWHFSWICLCVLLFCKSRYFLLWRWPRFSQFYFCLSLGSWALGKWARSSQTDDDPFSISASWVMIHIEVPAKSFPLVKQEYFNGANMMFLAAMGIAASVEAAGLHRRIALGWDTSILRG